VDVPPQGCISRGNSRPHCAAMAFGLTGDAAVGQGRSFPVKGKETSGAQEMHANGVRHAATGPVNAARASGGGSSQ